MKKNIQIDEDLIRFRPEKSEVDRLWAENKKARSLLNWKPKISGLEGLKDGLQKTIEWFQNADNLSGYRTDRYTI